MDLNRYDSFEEAASAQTNEPRTQYTTLKITGKTNRDTWTTDDRNYFRTNFSRVAELDLGNFTGTFGERAFEKSSIEKVRLPADVSIPIYMFSGCKSLATLSVGSNLPASGVIDLTGFTAAYGHDAFVGCTSIKEVKLPADVAIAEGMFLGCTNLDVLMFYGAGAPGVGFRAFFGVSDGGTLYYPQGGMDYTKGTFGAPDLANWDFIEAFGPEVVTQPSSQTGTVGQTAAFQFAVSGAPLAFRWQQSANNGKWTDLADGGGYAGTATDMLVIDNLQQEQNRLRFRCVGSNTGGYGPDITSEAAALTVNAATTLQPPSTPYDKAAAGNPQTGDLFDPRPYLLLMLSALAGCASLLRYRRRSA